MEAEEGWWHGRLTNIGGWEDGGCELDYMTAYMIELNIDLDKRKKPLACTY